MSTAAVIGASSPVGSAISRRLAAAGHEVVQVGDEVTAREQKRFLDGASVVVHAGEPSRTAEVLEASGAVAADHVVMLSTAAVYGAWPDNPVPITEDAVLRPNPGVGAVGARAETERVAAEWTAEHPSTRMTVLRPCPVVIPGGEDWPAPGLEGVAGMGSGDGTRAVQFLHIDDLAAAVVAVIDAPLVGAVNVAPDGWITEDEARALSGGRVVPLPEPVRAVARRFGIGRRRDATAALQKHAWVVANDRLRTTAWEPVYSNAEALVATRRPTWWQRLSPTKRQELSLVVLGGGMLAIVGGIGTAVLRRRRRSR
ncbi:MAG TPA: NAD-dependent epimerase/dehydratase family protein [Acidimicrobiales bacterium]|nr:NAD-dependent epimerase/dehydratase family protein [Acidimicrobiales bacterium]